MLDKQKLTQFRDEIDQILWKDWDPIGVYDEPNARDEYTRYADQICSKLINGDADKQMLLDYLFWVANDQMGIGYTKSRQQIDARNALVIEKIFSAFSNYHS